MKVFSRSQLVFLAILVFLLFSLPLAIFLTTQKQHDIRPRAALTGAANLLLNLSNTKPVAGDIFEVLVSAQITNDKLRVSGADFKVLYSASFLEAVAVAPAVGTDKPFTDVIINEKENYYDTQFNFVRVSEISRRSDSELKGGVVQLATIKFRAKNAGNAAIKFPDNDRELQIVGIDLAENPTPTAKPFGCPAGSWCTPNEQCRPASRIIIGGSCPENQTCCAPVEPTATTAPSRTPTPTPTPISCNLSVNPPIACPSGYKCQDPGIPGASGICVKNTPTPGGCNQRCCCVKSPNYDKTSSFDCISLATQDACTSMAPAQVCEWVCQ